jgi:hypothetical protein
MSHSFQSLQNTLDLKKICLRKNSDGCYFSDKLKAHTEQPESKAGN